MFRPDGVDVNWGSADTPFKSTDRTRNNPGSAGSFVSVLAFRSSKLNLLSFDLVDSNTRFLIALLALTDTGFLREGSGSLNTGGRLRSISSPLGPDMLDLECPFTFAAAGETATDPEIKYEGGVGSALRADSGIPKRGCGFEGSVFQAVWGL